MASMSGGTISGSKVITATNPTNSANINGFYGIDPKSYEQMVKNSVGEWVKKLFTKIGNIFDDIEEQIDKLKEDELDSSFRDRCIRDIRANGYDRLQEAIADEVFG